MTTKEIEQKYRINRKKSISSFIICVLLALLVGIASIIGLVEFISNPYSLFRYFTTISNLIAGIGAFVSVPFAIEGIRKEYYSSPKWVEMLLYIAETCVFITLLMTLSVILPTQGTMAVKGSNFFFHIICPILTVVLFNLVCDERKFSMKETLITLIPVVIYALIYAHQVIIVGENNGGWNDFYKTTSIIPFWQATLLVTFVICISSYANMEFHNLIVKKHKQKVIKTITEQFKPEEGLSLKFVLFEMGEVMSLRNSDDVLEIPLKYLRMLEENQDEFTLSEMVDIFTQGAMNRIENK